MIFFQFADLVSRLHVASCTNVISVKITFTKLNLRLLSLFYLEGFLDSFRVLNGFIFVYLRNNIFYNFLLFKQVQLFSTPGRRVFWKMPHLLKKISYQNFSGVLILSTHKGILSNFDALFNYRTSGEVLLKITI